MVDGLLSYIAEQKVSAAGHFQRDAQHGAALSDTSRVGSGGWTVARAAGRRSVLPCVLSSVTQT